MQIVIDISNETFENVKKTVISDEIFDELVEAFRNGTPFPKENTLGEWKKDLISFIDELDMPRDDYNGIIEYINEIPTIIEADKEDKDVYCL